MSSSSVRKDASQPLASSSPPPPSELAAASSDHNNNNKHSYSSTATVAAAADDPLHSRDADRNKNGSATSPLVSISIAPTNATTKLPSFSDQRASVDGPPPPPAGRLTAVKHSSTHSNNLVDEEEDAVMGSLEPCSDNKPLGSPGVTPTNLVLVLNREASASYSACRSTSLSLGNESTSTKAHHKKKLKKKTNRLNKNCYTNSGNSSALHSMTSNQCLSPQHMELLSPNSASLNNNNNSSHVNFSNDLRSPGGNKYKQDYVSVSSKMVPSTRAPDHLYKSPGANKFAPSQLSTHSTSSVFLPVTDMLVVHTRSSTNNSSVHSHSYSPDRHESNHSGSRKKTVTYASDPTSTTTAGKHTAQLASPKRAEVPRARTPPHAPTNYRFITTKASSSPDAQKKHLTKKSAVSAAPPPRRSPAGNVAEFPSSSATTTATTKPTPTTATHNNHTNGDSSRRLHYLQMWRDQRQRMEAKKEEVLSGPSTPSGSKGKPSWASKETGAAAAAARPVSASAAPVMMRSRANGPITTAAPTRVNNNTTAGAGTQPTRTITTRATTTTTTAASAAPEPQGTAPSVGERKTSLTNLTLLERRELRLSRTGSSTSVSPAATTNLSVTEHPSTPKQHNGTEGTTASTKNSLRGSTLLERRELRLSRGESSSSQSPLPTASLPAATTTAAEEDKRKNSLTGLTLLERREIRLSRTGSSASQSPGAAAHLSVPEPPAAAPTPASTTGLTLLERREIRLSRAASSASQSPGAAASLSVSEPPPPSRPLYTPAKAAAPAATKAAPEDKNETTNSTSTSTATPVLRSAATTTPTTTTKTAATPPPPPPPPAATTTTAIVTDVPPTSTTEPLKRPPLSMTATAVATTATPPPGSSTALSPKYPTSSGLGSPLLSERHTSLASIPVENLAELERGVSAMLEHYQTEGGEGGRPGFRGGASPWQRASGTPATRTTITPAAAAPTTTKVPEAEDQVVVEDAEKQKTETTTTTTTALAPPSATEEKTPTSSGTRRSSRYARLLGQSTATDNKTEETTAAAATTTADATADTALAPARYSYRSQRQSARVQEAKAEDKTKEEAEKTTTTTTTSTVAETETATTTTASAPRTRYSYRSQRQSGEMGGSNTGSNNSNSGNNSNSNNNTTEEKEKEKKDEVDKKAAAEKKTSPATISSKITSAPEESAAPPATTTTTNSAPRYSYRSQRVSELLEGAANKQKEGEENKTETTEKATPVISPPASKALLSTNPEELKPSVATVAGAAPARYSYRSQRQSVVLDSIPTAAEMNTTKDTTKPFPEEPTSTAPRSSLYARRLSTGAAAAAAAATPTTQPDSTEKETTAPTTTTTSATAIKPLHRFTRADTTPSTEPTTTTTTSTTTTTTKPTITVTDTTATAPASSYKYVPKTENTTTTTFTTVPPLKETKSNATSTSQGTSALKTPPRSTNNSLNDSSPTKSLGSIPLEELDTLEDSISTMLSYYAKHGKTGAPAAATTTTTTTTGAAKPQQPGTPAAAAVEEEILTDSDDECQGEGNVWYWCLDVDPIPIIVPPTVGPLDFTSLYTADDAALFRQSRLAAQPTPARHPEQERARLLQHVASHTSGNGGAEPATLVDVAADAAPAELPAAVSDKKKAVWQQLQEEDAAVQESLSATEVVAPLRAQAHRFTDTSDALDGGRGLEREMKQRERASRVQELLLICEEQRTRKKIVLAEMEGSKPWREFKP